MRRPAWPGGRRGLLLEGGLVYVLYQALTVVFLPALRTRGETFTYDVLYNGLGPDREAAASFLKDGFLPLWTRDLYGGQPFVANLQHAVYYPGNWPFLVLPPSTALKVVVATTVAFGAFAMWAYCRFALRTSGWAATLGGLAFGFGGMSLQHIILTNQLQVLVWMPLVLLFAHLALVRGGLGWVVATALAIGLQFLAGHPEEWVYTQAALGSYAAAWVLAGGAGAWLRRARDALVRVGGAMALFVALFGWQLFPTLVLRGEGYRQSRSFADQFPLPRESAVNALLPDYGHVLVGENVGYIGILALGLAGLGLAVGAREVRWIRIWMAALAAGGFLLALGNATWPYRFLYEHVEVVRGFRVPARYLLLPTFALSGAAALGLDVLLRAHVGDWRPRLRHAAAGLAVLTVGLVAALLVSGIDRPGDSQDWWFLTAAVGVLVWALATLPAVPRAAVALAVLAVTAVELDRARPAVEYRGLTPNETYNDYGPILDRLGREGGRFVTVGKLPREGGPATEIPVPPGVTGQMGAAFRAGFETRVIARPNAHIGLHAEAAIGRDAGLMPLRRYKEFFETATGVAPGTLPRGRHDEPPSRWNWEALDYLGVRWFVTNPLAPAEQAVLRAHGFRPVEAFAFGELWARRAPPLVRVTGDVDVVRGEAGRLARLRTGYPLRRRALVEEDVDVTPGVRGRVLDVEVGNTRVGARVATPAPALVVLADPWYPQWRVYVGGKRAELLRANHAFRAVRVPAGTHEVEFRYEDRAHARGLVLAGLAAAGLAAAALWRRRRPRGHGRPAVTDPLASGTRNTRKS